jgi:hypothetical protein
VEVSDEDDAIMIYFDASAVGFDRRVLFTDAIIAILTLRVLEDSLRITAETNVVAN